MAGFEWKLTVEWDADLENYNAYVFSRVSTGTGVSRWICRAVIVYERPPGPHKPERDFGEILKRLAP